MTDDELRRKAMVERGLAVVANQRKGKDQALLVRIDRKTVWGNPFIVGLHGDHNAVCDLYREYLQRQTDLMARLEGLRGKVLACWCYPLRCHRDELIQAMEVGNTK